MWALELWDLKDKIEFENDDNAKVEFDEMVGMDADDSDNESNDETVDIVKPEKPIFSLTADEIAIYFGSLLKDLYKLEGIADYKLWAKKRDGDVVKGATEVSYYD